MIPARLQLACLLPLLVTTAFGGSQSGVDPAKLKEVPVRLQKFVDDQTISGAVTLVGRHGRIASLEAVGSCDLATGRPMRPDNQFWIASMTKAITAVAVQLLQDAGKLDVDGTVEKYLLNLKND